MLEDFPKVDLSSKKDLDAALDVIRQHSFRLLTIQLAQGGLAKDKAAEKACKDAIDLWIRSARARLEPNVTVNGLPFKEGDDGAEPFDHDLSVRVQHLSEKADNLTAEAISARKDVPGQQAAAVQSRSDLLDRIGKVRERKRRTTEDRFAETMGKLPGTEALKLDRIDEVAETLRTAVADIHRLGVSLPEHTSAAKDQVNFVKRLRVMSASYEQ